MPGALLRGLAAAAARLREDLSVRLRDRRFWAVQFLVISVTAAHSTVEAFEQLAGKHLGAVYFVPASLYFVPVVYASLNFGKRGAIPTAIWCGLLALPNIVLWHGGMERLGEALQMLLLIGLAVVIAARVDRESEARRLAEVRERARQMSELKYRQLFAGAGEPVLVFDSAGVIQESNAAALALLRPRGSSLKGMAITRLLGQAMARKLMRLAAGDEETGEIAFRGADGSEIWMEPACTPLISEDQGLLTQVLLRDVTERRNFQSYAQEITRAQEEERARVSHELHDVALQSLVLLCRRLDAIQEGPPGAVSAETMQKLQEARGMAEGLADELRRFSRDLRPAVLDGLGLTPAIRRLVTELGARCDIDARLEIGGGARKTDPALELPLFRICQEALRNAERHSEASKVVVRLRYEDDCVRLLVSDNGKGLVVPSSGSLATKGRFGLLGIRERARLIGGSCAISSRPGKGTRVEVVAPLAPRKAALASPASPEELRDVS